jgi:DNA-directed RNA polymerase subunit RPC12/RpoP
MDAGIRDGLEISGGNPLCGNLVRLGHDAIAEEGRAVMEEKKIACPKCGSAELIVPLANEKHCNGCGFSFDLVKDPIGRAAQARKDARCPKTGWHKHGRE